MKIIVCIIIFLAAFANIYAGDGDYAVSKIPAELLKKANVVKRAETINFEITNDNKATFHQKVAYTILNENGDRWAYFAAGYDKLRSVELLEGSLYDANGKKLKGLKKGDIKDVSGNDDESLADDNRVKWHNFFYKVYPYTVEYELEIRYKGTMFLPAWIPQEKETMSVEQSSLLVKSPQSNPIHYKVFNYKGEPEITDEKSNKAYAWNVKNIQALEDEYASPPWKQLTTSVFLASEKFVLEDYQGSNASWKDFGKFVYDLKKERDALPDDVKQKVHELVDGLSDVNEKIRRLYEYMQQNTRYVSVSLGIGGWQPYDARYVADKKYGDCKALSNFMYALLKEAGIRSVYTVITSGDEDDYLLTDLPCSQFNHVILFVPNSKDTIWLECTSQIKPAGYLGGQTCNRYAVAVDENGGTLVRTPTYGLNENVEIRNISGAIDEDGNLEATVKTSYKGVQQDRLSGVINGLSRDKLMDFLKEDIELPTYDIRSFDYKEEKKSIPQIRESLDLVANNYASVTGKRLFVIPNILTRTRTKLKEDDERKFDIVLGYAFKDIDSLQIKIPSGYIPEAVPPDVKLDGKFGKYTCSVNIANDLIVYYRWFERYSGHFSAKDYPELVKFYDAVYKADRNKVVLVKKETN